MNDHDCMDETATVVNGKWICQCVKDPELDPTPWCHICGAARASQCQCPPRAEND